MQNKGKNYLKSKLEIIFDSLNSKWDQKKINGSVGSSVEHSS